MRNETNSRCALCGMDAPYYDADGLCPLCSPEFSNGRHSSVTEIYQNGAVESVTTCDTDNSTSELQRRARKAIETYGGIRPAARVLGEKLGEEINHGVIGMAANGKDFPAARRVLGMPPKPIPVYPCPSCGKVHKQLKECRPKPPPRDKVRLSLWVTREERDFIREAWDSHPGGRVAWNLEHAKDGRS